MTAVTLPPPLVKFGGHPLKWLKNKFLLLGDAVILAHIGMFIVVAIYYLLFEISPSMNSWWHHTVSNGDLRHSIRDVGEGVLGGFLAQAIIWNHFKKRHLKAGRLFKNLHDKFHIPETPAALLTTVIFGVVGFVVAYYGLHLFHVHATSVHNGNSFLGRSAGIWNSDWDKKIMGYAAALVARRPMRIVFDNVQAWFAERRVDLDKPVRFYHPPTFKARYNFIKSTQAHSEGKYGGWQGFAMVGMVMVSLGLAGFGYYVLTYIA